MKDRENCPSLNEELVAPGIHLRLVEFRCVHLRPDSCIQVRLVFSCGCFDQRKKIFFSLLFHFSLKKLKLLRRLDKGNEQERKTSNSLTWSNKMTFQLCNTPFRILSMKSFLDSAVPFSKS